MNTITNEKTPLQSKKFIAYFITNILMKGYIFYATSKGEGDVVIMVAIAATAFVDVGYILGQSFVDSFVRYASIVKSGVSDVIQNIEGITKDGDKK